MAVDLAKDNEHAEHDDDDWAHEMESLNYFLSPSASWLLALIVGPNADHHIQRDNLEQNNSIISCSLRELPHFRPTIVTTTMATTHKTKPPDCM